MTDAASRARSAESRAMQAYVEQAPEVGHHARILDVAQFEEMARHDAVFLRLDTAVLGLSYAASRWAWEAGLRVVDDPRSLLTCMNKAHVQGLLEHAGVPTPDTILLTRAGQQGLDPEALFAELGTPIVCKAPDGAFSSAVEKAADATALRACIRRFSQRSDVVLLQRYTPSPFDWRVGILCGEAIYAARYHIPRGGWRIHDVPEGASRRTWAKVERVELADVPGTVMDTAMCAARTVGEGLYGVDLKEFPDSSASVMEVNDNPNIDWGQELPVGSPVFGHIIARIAEAGPRA